MPEGEDLGNRIQTLFEAIVDEASFRAAEDRAAMSQKRTTAMTEAEFRNRIASENNARREGERIQAQMTRDEQRELQNRVNAEERQRKERAAIYNAMRADEARELRARNAAEKAASDERIRQERYEAQARESLQRQRSAAMIRIAKDEERAAAAATGRTGGGGIAGPGSNFALRRSIIEAGAVSDLGPLAGVASLAVYGPTFAGLALAIGAAGLAIKGIKDALADQKAEAQYAAAIRTIGISFDEGMASARSFRAKLVANREEAFKVATAFAKVQRELQTGPGDIKAISTIATAKGQSPEETAKILEAIAKSNREVFETETGLRAQIVVDEYAKSIGRLPNELTKAQEAQALYNKYLEQTTNLEDLANRRRTSAEGRWEKLKNSISDFSSRFGEMLLSGGPTTPGAASYLFFGGEQEKFQAGPQEAGIKGEIDRQKELNDRIEAAQRIGQERLKQLSVTKAGDRPEQRVRDLAAFRSEFESLVSDLDQDDPRIREVLNGFGAVASQNASKAEAAVLSLQKTFQGSLAEFANLAAAGDKNPFIKLYTDSESRAKAASEQFRLFGDGVVAQYNRMARAADEAAQYDLRVGSAMRATDLEFQAAQLSKPFTELTAEMKRTLSVLQAEIGAAVRAPGLTAEATAIDLYSRYLPPVPNRRGFGFFNLTETSGAYVQSQEFQRLQRLGRVYSGEGRGGDENRHILDLELIRLFGQLDPATRARALRQPGGEYAQAFGGAFTREARYAETGVERALERAEVGRGAVQLAQAKLRELDRLAQRPGADRDRTRAELLAITGALPREELTPQLLKGRIDALREEAQYQKAAEERAKKAVSDAREFQEKLVGQDGKSGMLGALLKAVVDRDEQVTMRILDETNRAQITRGPSFRASSASAQ